MVRCAVRFLLLPFIGCLKCRFDEKYRDDDSRYKLGGRGRAHPNPARAFCDDMSLVHRSFVELKVGTSL